MKKKNHIKIIFFIIAALIAIASIGHHQNWYIYLLSDSAPAWVQAVGSIAAVLAAALIAFNQNISAKSVEDRKKASLDKQKLQIIMALMARSKGLANDICRAYETDKNEDVQNISPTLMEDTHVALMALPVFEIPHWQLALDVLIIARGLVFMQEQFLEVASPSHKLSADEYKEKLSALNDLAQDVIKISKDSINICKTEIKMKDSLIENPSSK